MSAPEDHAAAAASASAAASSAPHRISPHEPQEPLDRSVPGPPLSCTAFHYAPGGDTAAQDFLLCPVSLQPLFDPVQCANGHYCCHACLQKLGGKCPVCRDASGVQSDVGVGLKQLLDSLRVECADCGEEVTRDRLLHHRNNLCQLPCERRCGSTVTRTGAAGHEPVCALFLVECDAADFGCAWEGVRCEQAAHHAVCKLSGVLPALRFLHGQQQATTQHLQEEIADLQEQVAQQQATIGVQALRIAQQQAALAVLRTDLDDEQHTRAAEDERLAAAVEAEQAAREAEDIRLAARLAQEAAQRQFGDAELAENLAQEAAQRNAADAALDARLGAMASLSPGDILTDAVIGMRDLQTGSGPLVERMLAAEAALRDHTAPLQWHTLGDAFCAASGVKLDNGWESYSGSYAFRFAKDAHGVVHLGGLIKGGQVDQEKPVLVLPEGYRPARWAYHAVDGGQAFGEVRVDSAGNVLVRAKGSSWMSFDGVSFSTK